MITFTSLVLALFGLLLAAGGIWLGVLGGSPAYLPMGIICVVVALLLYGGCSYRAAR